MAKKKLPFASKPRHANADQWVAGQTPATKEVAPPADSGGIKRLTLDLDAGLHSRFKSACAAHGLKMVDELRRMVERRTRELEAK